MLQRNKLACKCARGKAIHPTRRASGKLLSVCGTCRLLAILIGGLMTASIVAQDRPITIALAATSSTPAAFLLETFPKVGCSNISIILDESKADYILEAHGGDFEGGKGSEGAHGPRPPQPKARYTLFQNGTAVFGTTPVKEKNAVKDVCKFLQHGSSK